MPLVTQLNGYDLDELRALTLRLLRTRNTVRYSPSGGENDYDWIDDSLNRGQDEFVRKTLCLRTPCAVELKADTRLYRFPWNFLDFMTAYYYDSSLADGYKELMVTTIEQLNEEVAGWRTMSGTPEKIYVDRIYGNTWMFGVFPIPEQDGLTVTYDQDYGVVADWVCPLYTNNSEYVVILRQNEQDQFLMSTDTSKIPDVDTMDGNIWFEYYRLPEKIVEPSTELGTQGVIYPEIPKEYHIALPYYAVADLLSANPEDSVEFKRSVVFQQKFENEIKTYIGKRKKPVSAQRLRAEPLVWNWVPGMAFYRELP